MSADITAVVAVAVIVVVAVSAFVNVVTAAIVPTTSAGGGTMVYTAIAAFLFQSDKRMSYCFLLQVFVTTSLDISLGEENIRG